MNEKMDNITRRAFSSLLLRAFLSFAVFIVSSEGRADRAVLSYRDLQEAPYSIKTAQVHESYTKSCQYLAIHIMQIDYDRVIDYLIYKIHGYPKLNNVLNKPLAEITQKTLRDLRSIAMHSDDTVVLASKSGIKDLQSPPEYIRPYLLQDIKALIKQLHVIDAKFYKSCKSVTDKLVMSRSCRRPRSIVEYIKQVRRVRGGIDTIFIITGGAQSNFSNL